MIYLPHRLRHLRLEQTAIEGGLFPDPPDSVAIDTQGLYIYRHHVAWGVTIFARGVWSSISRIVNPPTFAIGVHQEDDNRVSFPSNQQQAPYIAVYAIGSDRALTFIGVAETSDYGQLSNAIYFRLRFADGATIVLPPDIAFLPIVGSQGG